MITMNTGDSERTIQLSISDTTQVVGAGKLPLPLWAPDYSPWNATGLDGSGLVKARPITSSARLNSAWAEAICELSAVDNVAQARLVPVGHRSSGKTLW